MYVYIHINIHAYVYIYIHTHIYIYTYIHIYIYIHTDMYTCVLSCVCVHVYVDACFPAGSRVGLRVQMNARAFRVGDQGEFRYSGGRVIELVSLAVRFFMA